MENIITLSGWGFGSNTLKEIWPHASTLTCEDLFKNNSDSPTLHLHEIINSLGKGSIKIIGWSLGGLIALDYCLNFKQVSELVLLSPTSDFEFENSKKFLELDHLKEGLRINRNKALKGFYLSLIGTNSSPEISTLKNIKNYLKESEGLSTDALERALTYLQTRKITQDLNYIKTPCTIIHGEQDSLIPLSHSKIIHQALINSTLKIIPKASHMLPYQLLNLF